MPPSKSAITHTTFGPFLGQRDTADPAKSDPRYARYLRNLFAPEAGGALRMRPGLTHLGKPATGQAQGVVHVSEIEGSEYTYVFVGGEMWSYDWTLGTFTEVTPGTVTINATGRVYARWFAGRLIVTDGVNRPWKFNPVDNTGAYLTDVPGAVYGPPEVYYAKLFFIKADERDTFIWSVENDPDHGYEVVTAGVTRAWTLRQTEQEPLVRLLGTNAALYYFREHTIGAILGPVTDEFVTTGVHDSVSSRVGTMSPDSVRRLADGSIFFVDHLARPWTVTPGAAPKRWWRTVQRTLKTANLERLASIWTTVIPDLDLVACAVPITEGNTLNTHLLMFEEGTGRSWGVWDYDLSPGSDFRHGCIAKDQFARPVFIFVDNDGDVYALNREDGEQKDEYADDLFMPEMELVTGWAGGQQRAHKIWDEAVVTAFRTTTAGPTITVECATNEDTYDFPLDVSLPDGPPEVDATVEVGIEVWGRLLSVRLTNPREPLVPACPVSIAVRGVALDAGRGVG